MTAIFLAVIGLLIAYGYATGSSSSTSASSSGSLSNLFGSGTTAQPKTNPTGIIMYSSDASLTGEPITNDPDTWPGVGPVWEICHAVALAEGYNVVNSVPYNLNNPGDLSPGDESEQQTCGGAQSHDGSSVIVFCEAEGGWTALYNKFNNIVNGNSSVYPASYTWTQVAQKYAGNWQDWLNNVTNYLGVDPTTTPAAYVAASGGNNG